jgi:hypothetical protein
MVPIDNLRAQLRLTVAGDTPPEALAALAESPSLEVRRQVGENPNTPVKTLWRLSKNRKKSQGKPVFAAVLNNPRVRRELLAWFGENSETVRVLLAENPDIPSEWLLHLADDKDGLSQVPESQKALPPTLTPLIADFPQTPGDILTALARSEELEVRRLVARNRRTPSDVLAALAREKSSEIREYVAKNPRTPIDILAPLAESEDWSVRRKVARNPHTPIDILAVLAEDTDKSVRRAALETLASPMETDSAEADA